MLYRIFLLIITLTISTQVFAIQTINVTRGHADPTPIAINDFASTDSGSARMGRDMIDVITNDLKNSGLFRPISKAAFIENKTGVEHKPLFASWRQINAVILLNGSVKLLENGKYQVSFMLWDTVSEQNIAGQILEIPKSVWRKGAHKIADVIYERVTGDKGYFDTKITYVSESGPAKRRIKRIAIMDQGDVRVGVPSDE